MYHAAVHDARNNTLILVVQSQRYALHGATEETVAAIAVETSVSETIRNPPLAEAQNAVGKQKKLRPRTIFNMVAVRRLEFYGTNNSKARVEMHKTKYGHTRSSVLILGTFVTVVMFGTPVAFWYTRDRISVLYTRHHS